MGNYDYDVVSYFAMQRTRKSAHESRSAQREARSLDFFLNRVMTWVLGGFLAGNVISCGMTQLLRNQLYGVQPNDPRVFVVSILILLIPVLLAAPALRAGNWNPQRGHYEGNQSNRHQSVFMQDF